MTDINSITRDQLVSDEIILEIFAEHEGLQREVILNQFREKAKGLGCLSLFNSLIKAAEKEEKEANKYKPKKMQTIDTNVALSNFNYPDLNGIEFKIPGYGCGEAGDIIKAVPGNNFARRICYHPVAPIKILKNLEDNEERVEIVYRDRATWRSLIVSRDVVSKASSIVDLSKYGVKVDSTNAKDLVQFFTDIECNNPDIIAQGVSTSKFGWTLNNDFIPYEQDRVQFDSKGRFPALYEAISEKGDETKWMNLAKSIRKAKRIEPKFYMIASLASVMLQPLHLLPFFVNLWTETGKGKTVALMLAASIWGNPSEGQYLTDPTSTKVAFEQRCQVLNNLPLMLDDLSKMNSGDNSEFVEMIYFLCGGKGKDRSNISLGITTASTWKNIIITNMERPLSSETMRGGAINRILDIECEEGSLFIKNGKDQGREIVELIKNNYGFLGKQFVQIVKGIPDTELKALHVKYIDLIKTEAERTGTEKEEKQIAPMAALLVADELVEKHIFKDGCKLDIEWCVRQLKNCEDVSENMRAWDNIKDFVVANSMTKFNKDSAQEQWGYIEKDKVFILPMGLRKIAEANNFSQQAFVDWAVRKGYLIKDNRGKNSVTKRHPVTGVSTRYYCLDMAESLEFKEVEDSDELPFK